MPKFKRYTPEERAKLTAEVKRLLREKDISQEEACKEAGVALATYSYWKNGSKSAKKKKAEKHARENALLVIDPPTHQPHTPPKIPESFGSQPTGRKAMVIIADIADIGAMLSGARF